MSGPMWICVIVIGIRGRQVLRPACLAVITLVLSTAVAPAQPPQQNAAGEAGDAAVFRPVAGSFPPLERAVTYRGELVFVDHANRRGSLRVQGSGMFFRNDPHPFALLPYAVVRYRTAPADLRDVPLIIVAVATRWFSLVFVFAQHRRPAPVVQPNRLRVYSPVPRGISLYVRVYTQVSSLVSPRYFCGYFDKRGI